MPTKKIPGFALTDDDSNKTCMAANNGYLILGALPSKEQKSQQSMHGRIFNGTFVQEAGTT
jgi:hypothetical protein